MEKLSNGFSWNFADMLRTTQKWFDRLFYVQLDSFPVSKLGAAACLCYSLSYNFLFSGLVVNHTKNNREHLEDVTFNSLDTRSIFLFSVAVFVSNIMHYHEVLRTWTQGALDYTVSHLHDDIIKWKHFPRYWPFVRGIPRSPVNSPHKGRWRGALMFILICARMNGWVNNREAGDLRRYRAHYDVIVM